MPIQGDWPPAFFASWGRFDFWLEMLRLPRIIWTQHATWATLKAASFFIEIEHSNLHLSLNPRLLRFTLYQLPLPISTCSFLNFSYEPELAPGLNFKAEQDSSTSLKLFSTGRVVIMGTFAFCCFNIMFLNIQRLAYSGIFLRILVPSWVGVFFIEEHYCPTLLKCNHEPFSCTLCILFCQFFGLRGFCKFFQ